MLVFLSLLAAGFGFFLWTYSISYLLYEKVSQNVLEKARGGLIRGMMVAGIFVVAQYIPTLKQLITTDWVIFPVLFYCTALPFIWHILGLKSLVPIGFALLAWFVFSFADTNTAKLFWPPFHEEIGKWYQVMTSGFAVIGAPFVSIGFGSVENFRYFSYDLSIGQALGRTIFSLPLHIFVTTGSLWVVYRYGWSTGGIIGGLLLAILCHTFYNWSLQTTLVLTIAILLAGYMFFGWSIEREWWRETTKQIN